MSAKKVQKDLSENHERKISKDYITNISNTVGKLIEQQERNWVYTLSPQAIEAQLITLGRDGTTMYLREDGYRETMNGTISFYDKAGNRVHTIYMAQAPQYGKVTFNERFKQEIKRVKNLVPQATYIGLADGAKDNWTFLDSFVEVSILDFWHASEYLTLASKAASASAYESKQWLKQARHDLRHEQGGASHLLQNLLQLMKEFRKRRKVGKIAKESLEKAIT